MIISGDRGRISEMINTLALETRGLLRQAVEIAWFSRGSIQYESVLRMSPLERDIAIEFVNQRIEAEKKKQFPIY